MRSTGVNTKTSGTVSSSTVDISKIRVAANGRDVAMDVVVGR